MLENGAGSPYRNWFHFDEAAPREGRPVNAYPAGRMRTGQPDDEHRRRRGRRRRATQPRRARGWATRRGGACPPCPSSTPPNRAVREYLWGVAEHWLRFGIDGWRLDVPAEIDDPAFWAEFRRRCRAVNPEAYLVGEIWHVAPEWVAGDRFDALMNYPLAEAIIGFVGGRSLNEALAPLAPRVRHGHAPRRRRRSARGSWTLLAAYAPETNAVQLNLLDSHDTPRVLSVLGNDREALELAVLLQATLPGAPCVYYGDEVGVTRRHRPGFAAGDALGRGAAGTTSCSTRCARRSRSATPSPRSASDAVALASAAGAALAFRRGGPGGPLARGAERRRRSGRSSTARAGAGDASRPARGGPRPKRPTPRLCAGGRHRRDRAAAALRGGRPARLSDTPAMSDLPLSLPRALEPAFVEALDPPGKLVAAIDGPGPGRGARRARGRCRPTARSCAASAAAGARVTHAGLANPLRLDADDASADVVLGAVVGVPRRRSAAT